MRLLSSPMRLQAPVLASSGIDMESRSKPPRRRGKQKVSYDEIRRLWRESIENWDPICKTQLARKLGISVRTVRRAINQSDDWEEIKMDTPRPDNEPKAIENNLMFIPF
jgi:hypothetical protein